MNKSVVALCALFAANGVSWGSNNPGSKTKTERPNILWITCEDISPYLGCYGCPEAHTPNLDGLAQNGIRFTHAYANAPVCAVARSTILSGMYASTIGTHQMRSRIQLPDEIPAYPRILREAGYYCTNSSKKDYNSNYEDDTRLWDESSNKAHYRNRRPGQPFFAVFNLTVTHESQLNKKRIQHYIETNQIPEKPRVHPRDITLPPYHPDLTEIREDWARLHDLITLMDSMSGNLLQELKEEGLADNTIVFFYSDHGGQLSRAKRYIYNIGTQVPFIVYLPDKWKHLADKKPGNMDDRMVCFVDLAKTVLSITGCNIPPKMQGKIFLGPHAEKDHEMVYFYRDRMAERYDFSRAVTDGRHYFIRNFMPHRPPGRDTRYGYQEQANWRAWEGCYAKGECNEIQSRFFQPKPPVELFDTEIDPWHVSDLSTEKEKHEILVKLSERLDTWMIETRDVGLIPEPMFHDLAGETKAYKTLYEYAQSNDYPIEQILEVAKAASSGKPDRLSSCIEYLKSANPIIRFWGAYGIFLTRSGEPQAKSSLVRMIKNDDIAANRIMAAQALGACGDPVTAFDFIMKEVNETEQGYVFLQGLNAFQYSCTDSLLSMEDWKRFKEKDFPRDDAGAGLGYHQRIIDDAMQLWPERRLVY
ncbi:MAG: sulfatase-like hydrolase/transferase [Prolixibacteraceae bacterium]